MFVSQIIARLGKANLVGRSEPGGDARVKPIALTSHGWLTLCTTLPIVEAFDERFFENRLT